jgi:hypothetical protein
MSRLNLTVEYMSRHGGWCVVLACPDDCQCGQIQIVRFKTAFEAIAWREHLQAGWCAPCGWPLGSAGCTHKPATTTTTGGEQ